MSQEKEQQEGQGQENGAGMERKPSFQSHLEVPEGNLIDFSNK